MSMIQSLQTSSTH